MTCEPLVSIIIPTVPSRKKELERAVASIWKQTYKNIELIVICDDTITSPAACNQGLDQAIGKYIAFLGDDDIYSDKDKIIEQVSLMERHPGCSLCVCWSEDNRFNMKRISKAEHLAFHRDIVKAFNYSSGSTYMIRNTNLRFDEELLSGQEYDLALRITGDEKGYAYCIPKVFVNKGKTPTTTNTCISSVD